jgi:antitoxin (DNA-binding transcriptional repressor) of toxin-antitoxin stability system
MEASCRCFRFREHEAVLRTRHNMCHDPSMLSVNIRQLRDTRKLKAWLCAGKTVELRERDRVIARIVPHKPARGNGLRLLILALCAKKCSGTALFLGQIC